MKLINRFLGVCLFVVLLVLPSNCHPEGNDMNAQTKTDTVKLLSSLSMPELISVGHEVMRLAKQQGIASTAMEKYFLDTLEYMDVVYDDVYVYDTPAPAVVVDDVYVYDAPAPAPVVLDFSAGTDSGSSHIGAKTFAQQVAEVLIGIFAVGALGLVIFGLVWFSNSPRITVSSTPAVTFGFPAPVHIQREIHIPGPRQVIHHTNVHHLRAW